MHMTPAMKLRFRLAGVLGLFLLIIDTWLAFQSGRTIDFTTGMIYGLISLGSGILLVIAAFFWVTNFKAIGGAIAIVWIPVFCFNIWSQIGMHTSARMTDVQQASVQNVKRGDVEKAKLELEAERVALLSAREALREGKGVGSGWSSTRPVAAWKSDISNMEGDKVFARSKQCANVTIPESRKFCDSLKELRANLAAAEEMEKTDKRIAAADRGLADVREKLAHTEAGHSTAENSSTIQAKILAGFMLASKPGNDQITAANEGTGITTAFLLCLMAAMLLLADAFPHLLEAYEINSGREPRVPNTFPAQLAQHKRQYSATPRSPAQPIVIQAPAPIVMQEPDHEARGQISRLNALIGNLASAYNRPRTI